MLLRVREESSVQVHPSGQRGNTVRTMWCSRLDAILGKASRVAEVQPSRRGLVMEAFSSILEGRLQLTVRTPSSILIITLCSNSGLGWNWCHWKANKKRYNFTIWTAKRNIQTRAQSPNPCWYRPPYLSWNRICKAYIKRALGMYIVQNSVLNSLSFERVFRENRRSASSQAIADVCSLFVWSLS